MGAIIKDVGNFSETPPSTMSAFFYFHLLAIFEEFLTPPPPPKIANIVYGRTLSEHACSAIEAEMETAPKTSHFSVEKLMVDITWREERKKLEKIEKAAL